MINQDKTDFLNILTKSIPFSYMKKEDVALFANTARLVERESGAYLYHAEQRPVSIIVVISGTISNCTHERDGRLIIEGFAGPGDSFGWLSMVDSGMRSSAAIVHGRATVLTIPTKDVLATLKRRPQIWESVARLLAERLRKLKTNRHAIVAYELEQRVACILVERFRLDEKEGVPFDEVPISQEEIANLAASSRQSVNKCLNRWQREGLVGIRYNKLRLLEANALRDLATGLGTSSTKQ